MSFKDRIGAFIGGLVMLLIFGGISGGAFWVIGKTIQAGMQAEDWVKVRAEVRNVSEGSVTYAYDWQGKKYVGDRTGTFVLGGSSSVDDWEDRMDAMLTTAQNEKKPITIFVNPANPSESLMDREIRWALLFAFCLPFAVGFGAGAVFALYLLAKAVGLVDNGRPLLKPQVRTAFVQWGFALVWNSIAFPIAVIAIPSLWSEGEWFPVILLSLFPLIGLLVLWGALASTFTALRQGNPFAARTARAG
jgi:hypothetical protein